MYPIDKYKFYQAGTNKIVAVSTYAGRTVRGVAKCDSRDTFDLQKGKELAAARCAEKIATKRLNRANKKYNEAYDQLVAAERYLDSMAAYMDDACCEQAEAVHAIESLLASM